ncbi:response regulator transcription factor [Rhodococcus erythropolis]|uniref:response regulator transcription factor n=1 Tax=Rhodococcus erythropolis TaxID=1833 RepID=UPI0022B5545D|nr:response regulator transcription factor [Rhodococcus erythropolis]MCZ4566990.1 response regulator transcription factor [Rhodococcus erythropolis]
MTAPDLTEITVALIDDHDVVHEGLASWCAGATPPIEVAGRYLRPTEFLRDRVGGQGVRIDAVVLDLQFGDGSPLPALDMVSALTDAGYRVIIYSMRSDAATILDCLDNGAVTYLTKSEGRQHLVPAIEAAVTDHPYLSPSMAGAMSADTRASRPKLTEREREVLIQWFRTESKTFAAKALYITASTLATHLGRVRTKYAAAGRPAPTKAALVARALQDGIISIDDL